MFTEDEIRAMLGADVRDNDGSPIGIIGQVWLDTAGTPAWVGVRIDPSRPEETLMPLAEASFTDGTLRTPYGKSLVLAAPHVDIDTEHPWDSAGLQSLYEHYALTPDTTVPRTASGTDDNAMTRSEERLRVDMQQHPTGKVRLRKHIVTDYVTTPVRREELRVEHVPLDETDEGQPISQAPYTDAGEAEAEAEAILYAERPVVTMETVPVERVSLHKHTVTEQQTLGGEIRKEHIELDLPDE